MGMNIRLIGTNHLMYKEQVEELIKKEKPDIIGIELCEFREAAILDNQEMNPTKEDGLLGKITSKIKSKAEEEGLDYGSDMKTALRYSIKNNIQRVLVDMPILKIQELFNKIPLKEQQGFARELKEFEKESITKKVNEEEVLINLKSRYPIAFEFLINMRNLFIANEILKISIKNQDKKIVVILGAAHVSNVNKLIGG